MVIWAEQLWRSAGVKDNHKFLAIPWIKWWSLFLLPLNLNWSRDWLWPAVQHRGSDTVLVVSLSLQRQAVSVFVILEASYNAVKKLQDYWMVRGNTGKFLELKHHLVHSRASPEWSQFYAVCRRTARLSPVNTQNCKTCYIFVVFKPFSFGVICYTEIATEEIPHGSLFYFFRRQWILCYCCFCSFWGLFKSIFILLMLFYCFITNQ